MNVVLAVVIGMIGVVYPDQLKAGKEKHEITWQFVLFVASLVYFAINAWQWMRTRDGVEARRAKADRRRAREDRERVRIDRLRSDIHDHITLLSAQPKNSPEEQIHAILQAMANVVLALCDSEGIAGANLMVFQTDKPSGHVRFLFSSNYKNGTPRGYLVLNQRYSAVAPERQDRDRSLEEFALPVNDGWAPDLPGAPTAFTDEHLSYEPDAQKLHEDLEGHSEVDPKTTDAISEYFTTGRGKNIGTMICLPVPAARPVAVVNIHHSRRYIVRSKQAQRDFANAFAVFVGPLAAALPND